MKLRRGKHTTRTVRLLETGRGGVLADTPGFNLPSLDGVTSAALPESFPEITSRLEENRWVSQLPSSAVRNLSSFCRREWLEPCMKPRCRSLVRPYWPLLPIAMTNDGIICYNAEVLAGCQAQPPPPPVCPAAAPSPTASICTSPAAWSEVTGSATPSMQRCMLRYATPRHPKSHGVCTCPNCPGRGNDV